MVTRCYEEVALRPLTPADAEAAAALDGHTMVRPWSTGSWEALLSEALVFGWAAELGGDLVAISLARAAAGEAEILVLAVAPRRRRRGIASSLVIAMLDEAHRRGAERTFLEVGADNGPALALYRGFGFIDVGRRSGYYSAGQKGDALVLVHGPAMDVAPACP